jgi:hypothetical protein
MKSMFLSARLRNTRTVGINLVAHMTKKLIVFLLLITLAPLIGGIYGVIHDQLTYTISPEYYTRFKFIQFGLIEQGSQSTIEQPRILVSIVGFLATWWMGVPIGIVLGFTGLIHSTAKKMFRITMQSFGVAMAIAFLCGIFGLAYGRFHLAITGVDWWLPENLADRTSFIAVGSMHNYSYFGGILDLLGGIVYSCKRRIKPVDSNTLSNSSGFR